MTSTMPLGRGLIALLLCSPAFTGCGTSVIDTSGSSSGTGAGGAGACVPGTLVDCYTGAANTEGVGVCHGGAKKCNHDGMTFGECQWEVTPTAEDCKTPEDEDCDGQTPPCAGESVWSDTFGGTGNEYGQNVAVDPAGNVVVTGGFDAPFTLGSVSLANVGQDDVV